MFKPALAAASAALLLAAAGCADRGSPDAAADGRAPVAQPTGAPIVLGLTNQEGAIAGSWPELRAAASAAVSYINAELGGAHGRPLKLETCITNGSPEASAKCANTILAKKPLVLLGGADVGTNGSMAIYTKANMPYLGGVPLGFEEMSAPNSVQWSGFAVGGLPAMAAYAGQQLKAKKVLIIYPGLAGTADFVTALMHPVLKAVGVTGISMMATDISQPDKTAVITAAAQTNADAMIVIDAGAGCLSILQAHATLAPDVPLLITGNCVEGGNLKTAGATAEGVYSQQEFLANTDPANPDVKVFTAAVAKYAPADTRLTAFSAAGFAGVMNIYRALTELPTSGLTAQAILAKLKSAKSAPNFMGAPYTCDGRIKLAPSVCNTANRIIQVKNGKLVDVSGDWFDGTRLLG